ncbi:tRNA splicing endonuclease subunit sen2 [Coemansia sp. RSA 2703]|nr:tRNA splicing endonuclease subunit sen2 [Coemansia sp. RSA 2703]KAJ2379286.1 tRNA splicing endonuclease subunit sen2 [Coemansia sp. RSA 2607]KAJ2398360.1 tRNA splicing endonuclease subunit sen2 [Coemansia sp. RSA 2603]
MPPKKNARKRAKGKNAQTFTPLPVTTQPAILPHIGFFLDHISTQLLKATAASSSPLLSRILSLIPRVFKSTICPLFYLAAPHNLFWPVLRPTKIAATVYMIGNIDCSVWVASGMVLWSNGAFGKGILSRSDATWYARYQQQANRKSSSGQKTVFLEDITQQRRRERQTAANVAKDLNQTESSMLELNVTPSEAGEMEPVQLSPYEVIFLLDSGYLEPTDSETGELYSSSQLWKLYCQSERDFDMKYAAYYYYRSKGWVVRSGIKFGSDFLLYDRGPAHSHSRYSIVVRHRREEKKDEDKHIRGLADTWQYVFALSRVTSQVQKQLVICYVDRSEQEDKTAVDDGRIDICQYTVEELTVARFNPNLK